MASLSLGAPPAGPEGVKRRRRTYVVVGVAVAVLAIAGFAAARQPESTVSATPGYRDVDRPIDTSPFELAGATERGTNTTIAGLDGVADEAPTTTSTSPPTVPPPPLPTTTTLPPPSSDPVCRAYYDWIVLTRAHAAADTAPSVYAAQAVVTMRRMGDLLSRGGDPAFGAAATLFRDAAERLKGATTAQQVADVILPIITEADPAVVAAIGPLRGHVDQQCRDLRAAALE